MYATIRCYKAKSSPDLIRKVNEGFLPTISKAPGFIAFYAVDSGTGELASISVFETRAGAEDSNKAAADWVKKNNLTIGQPEKTLGEVIAHKTAQRKTQTV